MKLAILTIALDAMKFLPAQFYTFSKLPSAVDWTWYISEGRAEPVKDTGWCQKLAPRLSIDGTTQFLNALRNHPRVKVFQQQSWPGKAAMFAPMLECIKEPTVGLQVDVDELYSPETICKIVDMFWKSSLIQHARFDCFYHVGQNIITVTDNAYGHNPGEWYRAFRLQPGMRMLKHEPPQIEGIDDQNPAIGISRNETRQMGIHFTHMAYVYPEQVRGKEEYYGYRDALTHWHRLQNNKRWPVKLKDFLPWSDSRAMADLLFK